MAVRLPVLMVHTPPASAAAQRLAEAVIGELIGRPGIDMVLIGSTAELADDSTDRITLDSLTGDAAVLDWRTPDEIVAGLQRNGLTGVRAPHRHDAEAAANQHRGRKIYAFDLRKFSDAAKVAAAVMQLNQNRQVRTFSLSPLGSTARDSKKNERGAAQAASQVRRPEPVRPASSLRHSQDHHRPANVSSEKQPHRRVKPPDANNGNGEDIDLDDLLDQLDQSDP